MDKNEQFRKERIELTCRFNVTTLENGRAKSNMISIFFPMAESEIEILLETHKSSIENGNAHFSNLRWTDESYLFENTEMDSLKVNDLHDLNKFTQRLSGMSDEQRIKLRGLYANDTDALFFTSKGGPYCSSIVKGINLTYNIDNIEFIQGISKAKQLGEYCVENNLIKELKPLSAEIREYLNYDFIGQKYCIDHNGVFLNNAFVYNIPKTDQLIEVYSGQEINQTEESISMGFGGQSM